MRPRQPRPSQLWAGVGVGGTRGVVGRASYLGMCGFERGAGMAALLTCKRYLLAFGQSEGKLVIVAVNQTWTEEKPSDFL